MSVEICPTCDIAGCHHIRDRADETATEYWIGPRGVSTQKLHPDQRRFVEAKAPPLRFAPPVDPGGRINLMLGNVQIGAVFTPGRDPAYGGIWHYGFWLGMKGSEWSGGHAKTEQAAKNALIGMAKTWLQQAGVE